jgi:hypothetical protein
MIEVDISRSIILIDLERIVSKFIARNQLDTFLV